MASISALPTTDAPSDQSENRFFEDFDNYIDSLKEKFREKHVIKKNTYDTIMTVLSLEKGKSSRLFTPAFAYWARKHFEKNDVCSVNVLYCLSSKKPVCVYQGFFNIIQECHHNVAHGGRDKTVAEVNSHWSCVPKRAVEIYLKHCSACQLRQPVKQPTVSKPIIALGFLTRLQVDLIDFRTRPDNVSQDMKYQWILHAIDHFSKYTFPYPLKTKSAVEVAQHLRQLFYTFGPPRLLHSDNGSEFIAAIVTELKSLFPSMSFIRGRPRHPQSQGAIERANGVLTDALGKWMFSNQTDHWSEGLMPVVYGINTRVSQTTKVTADEVVFGQKARCDSDYWCVVNELNCVEEDDLPTPVEVGDDYKDNMDKDVNNVIESLLDLSEHVAPAPPLHLLDASISIIETEPQVNPPYTADVSVNLMSFTSPTKIPVQSST
ncbi:unnamed protein product, partial [Didymodactylos carnosus]